MDKELPNAAEVLGQLSTSLGRMLELLQVMVTTIRPPSANTLPTVSATLSGIAEATEHAALRVLDEAEALQDDQARLTAALERLRAKLPSKDTEAAATWAEAAACSNALSARALKIMAAMEFQDLTAQHIDRTVTSIADVRERLRNVLTLFDLHVREAVLPDASPIGPVRPFTTNHDGQALADQLLAEHK
ncbi:MAG: protein phosphatase CheZ [Candidatus Rokubacteria bacterium]|nr:protein phosphatase CheZ [Candidatus Rokubacteria bacterium]